MKKIFSILSLILITFCYGQEAKYTDFGEDSTYEFCLLGVNGEKQNCDLHRGIHYVKSVKIEANKEIGFLTKDGDWNILNWDNRKISINDEGSLYIYDFIKEKDLIIKILFNKNFIFEALLTVMPSPNKKDIIIITVKK